MSTETPMMGRGAALLFFGVFALYLYTLHPTVAPYRDAGDLAVAAHTLGIAHPPGYPVYALAGKITHTIIPWGNSAYRLNILSACSGAAAIACGAIALCVMGIPAGIAAGAAVLLAFTPALWRLSQVSEMYALNALFASMILLCAARFVRQPDRSQKLVWALGFLCGLAAGNHQTILFLIPGLLWLILSVPAAPREKARMIGQAALFFFLGSSVYLYVVLRASASPLWMWGSADSVASLLRLVTRGDYGGLKLHPEQSTFSWSVSLVGQHLLLYGRSLGDQFTLPGCLLGLVGIIDRRAQRYWRCILLSLLVSGPGFVILSNLPPAALTTLPILESHFVLPNVLFSFFVGAGGAAVGRRWGMFAVVLLAGTCTLSVIQNAPRCSYRGQFFAYDYGKDVFRTAAPGSILYDPDDATHFITSYLQIAHGRRPDIVTAAYFRTRWGYERLKARHPDLLPQRPIASGAELAVTLVEHNAARRPVYADVLSKFSSIHMPGCSVVPHGILYRFMPGSPAPSLAPFMSYGIGRSDVRPSRGDFFSSHILSYYASGYSNAGIAIAAGNDRAGAREAYYAALRWDPTLVAAYNNLGILAYQAGKYDEAISWYLGVRRRGSSDPSVLFNLGLALKAKDDRAGAEQCFLSAWTQYGYVPAGNEAGLALIAAGKPQAAAQLLAEIVRREPGYAPALYNLGLAYRSVGDRALARQCFEAYARMVVDPREKADAWKAARGP